MFSLLTEIKNIPIRASNVSLVAFVLRNKYHAPLLLIQF